MYFGSSNTPAQGLAAAQPKKKTYGLAATPEPQPLGLALRSPTSQPAAPAYKPVAPGKGYGLMQAAPPGGPAASTGGGDRSALMAQRQAFEALAETFRGSPMEMGYRGMIVDIDNKIAAIPAQPVVGSFGSPAAAPRAGASQYTPVPAPRTGAGLISGGPSGNQTRGAFAGQNATGVAPNPAGGTTAFDPFAYNRQALSGLAGATKRLEGLANPYADPSGQQALGLAGARRALDSQGTRDSIHGRNDAINRMMAGGGLLAQQDLNALNDNVRAGVMNQQAGLASEYANRSVDWETQRRQEVARQYERQAGLASSPYQLSQEQLRAEEASQRLWETQMTGQDRIDASRLGLEGAGIGNQTAQASLDQFRNMAPVELERTRQDVRRLAQQANLTQAEAEQAFEVARNQGWYAFFNFLGSASGAIGSALGKR